MQRIVCPERDDWRQTAEACGFDFHTIDDERYWDERGYYAFTLEEIERRIEAPTGEIDEMCLALVEKAISVREFTSAGSAWLTSKPVCAVSARSLATCRVAPFARACRKVYSPSFSTSNSMRAL